MRVAIVGLGTAGAAAAALCAERGLQVVGVERGPLDQAGARWVNGVPAWVFDAAGVARPTAPELRGGPDGVVHLRAGWTGSETLLRGVMEVDMRHLTERLQGLAQRHGADLMPGVTVHAFDGGCLETSAGRLEADAFVDASGLNGVRLLDQPGVDRQDLCAASQQVHAVADAEQARAWFAHEGIAPGEVLIFTGVAGGYSILNVHQHGDEISLLTGSIPALGHPGGQALLDAFVADHPFIGPVRFGGRRAIPLRRPWMQIARGNVAAIGDAACQVYAAHGSGIAQQLLAARMLADALCEGVGPAGYNIRYQRTWGSVLAASDLFRRFSDSLDADTVDRLIARRVIHQATAQDTLLQRTPRPPLRAILQSARGLASMPGLARRLVPVLARGPLLERHYRRYPEDPARLPAWVAALERLTGVREPR